MSFVLKKIQESKKLIILFFSSYFWQAEVPYQFSRSVSILVFKNGITQRININF